MCEKIYLLEYWKEGKKAYWVDYGYKIKEYIRNCQLWHEVYMRTLSHKIPWETKRYSKLTLRHLPEIFVYAIVTWNDFYSIWKKSSTLFRSLFLST